MRVNLPYSTDGMSRCAGSMFDPLLQYFYPNAAMGGCRDEEKTLSYYPELGIEVPDLNL